MQTETSQNNRKHIFHPPLTPDKPPTSYQPTKPKESPQVKKDLQKGSNSTKCMNRECNNKRGFPLKPNSIYCSTKCQSREQNLRQGRVKAIRKRAISRKSHAKTPQPIPSNLALESIRIKEESCRNALTPKKLQLTYLLS